MAASTPGLIWLAVSLFLLLFFQRQLQREFQIIFYLITRRADLSLALFSILFFPGVLLHEVSHFLAAKILGVRTGHLSLIPRPKPDGKLQMGYLEVARVDWIRDALIGAAPLLIGGLVVAYISISKLFIPDLITELWEADTGLSTLTAVKIVSQPDVWLWFYLAFVISSTMIPSSSDRKVWLPLGLFILILVGASLFLGAGSWLVDNLAPAFNRMLNAVVFVIGMSLLLHVLLLPPVWMCRKILGRLMKVDVVI